MAEQGQPVPDIGRVIRSCGLVESELCAPERRAQLGDEFLGTVGEAAESSGEVTVQSTGVARSMGLLLSAPVRRGVVMPKLFVG